ncbi:Hypothetical protein NTJ_02237 [Nesidiocoris tenuis]|uniref:Uncharacterized protein n=1 Tax=Nesidiocoris tenuis TaxID=355587 RepID=A0ABN7AEZ7_9HEMI|nr:Hypothetical protein NTJ_02237 [Nesidiocoris tenuis]
MEEPQQSTSAVQKGDELERLGRLQIPRAKLKRNNMSEGSVDRPSTCGQQSNASPQTSVTLTADLCTRK